MPTRLNDHQPVAAVALLHDDQLGALHKRFDELHARMETLETAFLEMASQVTKSIRGAHESPTPVGEAKRNYDPQPIDNGSGAETEATEAGG